MNRVIASFADDRLIEHCVYCGSLSVNREHAPPKVLVKKPLPKNMAIVPACNGCNGGFSNDEEWLAGLVAYATNGDLESIRRTWPEMAKTLDYQQALRGRLENQVLDGWVDLTPDDIQRMNRVLAKIARGLAAHELSDWDPRELDEITVQPISIIPKHELDEFLEPVTNTLWPEVGSRAMQRIASSDGFKSEWIVIQAKHFAYMCWQNDAVVVRMCLADWLVCEVRWNPID